MGGPKRRTNERRILHAIPTLGVGGAERQLAYLSAELVRRGWSVHVVYRESGANAERFRTGGVTLHQLGGGRNANPLLGFRYAAALRDISPGVVQTWLAHSDVFVGAATRVLGIPWIISERASLDAYPPTWKNALRVLWGRRADAVVANSRAGADFWRTRLPARLPCVTIPNAIPLDEIAVLTRTVAPRSGEGRRILFVGRLDAGKNPRTVFRALTLILKSFDATLVLCGDGPQRQELERLALEQHLLEKVQLLGARSDIFELMATANVFVSPSFFEGHPNAVLEAAACGCPIVASDIPAHREFLDETTAVFVDPESPESVAAAVCQVFADPSATRRRVERAHDIVHELSIGSMADRYEYVYDTIMRRAPLTQRDVDRAVRSMAGLNDRLSDASRPDDDAARDHQTKAGPTRWG
jgi:glycosyltransferase involved in cell wall biosynthesis